MRFVIEARAARPIKISAKSVWHIYTYTRENNGPLTPSGAVEASPAQPTERAREQSRAEQSGAEQSGAQMIGITGPYKHEERL